MSKNEMPEKLKKNLEAYLDLEYSKQGISSKPFMEGASYCYKLLQPKIDKLVQALEKCHERVEYIEPYFDVQKIVKEALKEFREGEL